jgi:membrane-associated protein
VKWLLILLAVMAAFAAGGYALIAAAHTGPESLPGTYAVASAAGPGTAEITTGDQLTLTAGGNVYTSLLVVTAARKTEPASVTCADGPDKGKSYPALVRWVRGELTLVLSETAQPPVDITATEGTRRFVLTQNGATFAVRSGRTLAGIVANLGNPDAWKTLLERPEVYWPAVAVLALIIFAETGLLVGFFLPGDSLLVTVGIVARVVGWDIVPMLVILSLAAVVGDTVGYWVGAKGGPAIFNRPESRWFKHDHLVSAKGFFDRHGGKTLVIARFMPFARTFVPVVAGAAKMSYSWFLTYNVIGGVAWIVSMLLFGYTATDWLDPLLKGIFGPQFKLEKNIDILAVVIIALSLAPMAVHWLMVRGKKPETGANNVQ